jgi:hypothetical protein
MPTYTCLCCGHTETFETADEAFEAGWDMAAYFTLQPLCDFCPSSPVLIHRPDDARRLHVDEHSNWKKHGRSTPLRELAGEEPNQRQDWGRFVGKTASQAQSSTTLGGRSLSTTLKLDFVAQQSELLRRPTPQRTPTRGA